jgi:hypothetical protein
MILYASFKCWNWRLFFLEKTRQFLFVARFMFPSSHSGNCLLHSNTENVLSILSAPPNHPACVSQSENIAAKWKDEVVEGFRQVVSENICDALEPRYYEQLYKDILRYTCVLPRRHLKHLETKWVILDKTWIKAMVKNYTRGWNLDTHFTNFAKPLDLDQQQKKLL